MYASLGSGPVVALPASVPPCPLGSWSPGGGRGCVRQERKCRGCVRSSVRGANVWQVSEAASFGVSSFGRPLSALPRRYLDPSGAQPDSAAPLCPRPTPSPPRALFQASSWPLALQVLRSHPVGGGCDAWRPPHLSWVLVKRQPCKRSLLRVRWVGRPPVLVASPSSWFRSSCFL